MSDTYRKSFSDKVQEKLTPDSSKSGVDRTKENLTGAADKVSANLQPDSTKSNTQAGADKTSREKASILDKTKHALGMDKH